jgi:drug/metabolite transporter (DMT)-like permease
MWVVLALIAMLLTSFLPICTKQLLRDAPAALVAWAINAISLPLLAGGTFLLLQCRFTAPLPLSCTLRLPQVDPVFVAALVGSSPLNWAATLLSTHALSKTDASLATPLLTFNPAFTLLVAWLILGEIPGAHQTLGVAVVLFGAYLLEVQEARTGVLAPFLVLVRRPGALLAMVASALWGTTTVLEKLSIDHMSPPSGPLVALLGTFLMVLLLTPGAFRSSRNEARKSHQNTWRGLRAHPCTLSLAVLIAGLAPLFGFTAIALGLVGYVTALFKLSAVLTILWARWFLGEGQIRSRLLGASVMIVGGALVAI